VALTVVTFKWKNPSYRTQFVSGHVNVLQSMVRRRYRRAHRFVCVTDDPAGLDSSIEVVPLWTDFGDLPSPYGRKGPSCYRRLKLFSRDAAKLFGERFVCLDLDCVLVDDVAPLWDRPERFVIWGSTAGRRWLNGSMFLLQAGALPEVWERFDPDDAPRQIREAGLSGSDQGWIEYLLQDAEGRWNHNHGVYSYRTHVQPAGGRLPPKAKIVFFNGGIDPWSTEVKELPWIRQNYR
jgi:hypothetical protein